MDSQFVETLKQSLAASLSPDTNTRQQAEQFLSEAQKRPDYCSSLLEVSANGSFDQNLALAAAVQLGQTVDYHWKFIDQEQAKRISLSGFNYIILSDADKNYVRSNIVSKMFECQNMLITKQYVRCIITICRMDYPQTWPTLLNDIQNALNSDNDKGVLTGLISLFCLAKKYEFELEEDRKPLEDIMQQLNELLGNIINKYMGNLESEVSLTIMHQIVKVFYVSNQLCLCSFLRENNQLSPWIQMLKIILDMAVPAELESATDDIEDIAQRDKHILWKLKGQAARITFRLFSRYANPEYIPEESPERQWNVYFLENFGEMLCESHLQLMFKRKTHFVGSKTLNFVVKLVSSATKIPLTMNKMLPFMDNILYETAIPLMLVSNRDQQLFHDDPVEYIRKQYDVMETVYMPKITTVELLQLICQYKTEKGRKIKPNYLVPFLNFASSNMQQYSDAVAAGGNPDWRVKEALLNAVGNLTEIIGLHKDLKGSIEPMLKAHVLPDFNSPHPMLKSRACWIYGEVAQYEFKEENHIQMAVDGIYQCLFSEFLPIRFQAACALSSMLHNETAVAFLKPALENLLKAFLKIMEEIDQEELMNSMDQIMEVFADDIGPYAVQLAQQITKKYQSLVTEEVGDDDDLLEERSLAAVGCVATIRRILEALHHDKNGMRQVLPIIYPIMMHCLTVDGLDSIDDGLDCINVFLYYACSPETRVPQELWKLLPQMMFIVAGTVDDVDGGFAHEQLSQVIVCLQNFIKQDPASFMACGEGQTDTHFHLAIKFIQRLLVINSNTTHKMDGVCVLRALITIFETLPGQIENELPGLVGMLLAELHVAFENSCPKDYKKMIFQSIMMAIYNSGATTLAIIENEQQTLSVFGKLIQFIDQFKLEFEIRRMIFGLLSILKLQPQQMSPTVQQQLPQITKKLSELVGKVYQERLKSLESNEKFVAKGFEDTDSDEDDDEDFEENPNEVFQKTKDALMALKNGGSLQAGQEDDDDDSDYEENAGEMALYDSPMEEVDELVTIKETLDGIFQADPNAYQYLVSAIPEDQKNQFVELLGKADELKAREKTVKEAIEKNELAKKVQSIKA